LYDRERSGIEGLGRDKLHGPPIELGGVILSLLYWHVFVAKTRHREDHVDGCEEHLILEDVFMVAWGCFLLPK
jgi:hypothetical protein